MPEPQTVHLVGGTGRTGRRVLRRHLVGCDAVISCLGHVFSPRGIIGPPRDLVARATTRLCWVAALPIGLPVDDHGDRGLARALARADQEALAVVGGGVDDGARVPGLRDSGEDRPRGRAPVDRGSARPAVAERDGRKRSRASANSRPTRCPSPRYRRPAGSSPPEASRFRFPVVPPEASAGSVSDRPEW